MKEGKATWFLIAAFTTAFAVYFCAMPLYLDDLWFGAPLKDWIEGAKAGIPFSDIWEIYIHHWEVDNIRLANVVYTPWLLMPRWIPALLAALCWGAATWLMTLMAGVGKKDIASFSIFLFFLAFGLPWHDTIGCLCYLFNYVIASFIGVAAIWVLLNRRGWLFTGLLGLLLGAWHEGFSVPVLCGVATAVLLKPQTRSKSSIAMMTGLVIGIFFLFTSPGAASRMTSWEELFTLNHIFFLVPLHAVFWIMLLLTVITVCGKRRSILLSPLFIILFVSAMASLGINFFGTRAPRTGWWCELASAWLVLMLLKQWKWGKVTSVITTVIFTGLTFAHLVVVDYYAIKMGETHEKWKADLRASKDGVIFEEFTDEHQAPLIAWSAPDFTYLLSQFSISTEKMYNSYPFMPCLVPKELEYYKEGMGMPLDGNIGLRRYRGRLVIPADNVEHALKAKAAAGSKGEMNYSSFQEKVENIVTELEFKADVDFGFKIKKQVRIAYHPFTSKADGKRYAYLYPWRVFIEERLGDVEGITAIE